MRSLGIYVHIPFCTRKCYYCSFISYPCMEHRFGQYVLAVINEAYQYKKLLKECVVDTVFIGGGTPSVLESSHIAKLVNGLKKAFKFEVKEFSIEANPETLTAEKIYDYEKIGINRISIGLQTHDDKILKRIGRRHTWNDFVKAYDIAKSEFGNISIDTIFGLPGQTVNNFLDTVNRIASIKPQHISAYSLDVESSTKLAKTFLGADESADRAMYHGAIKTLEKLKYIHYETSNFALHGFECMHNIKYWTGAEYLGLGCAAHSLIDNVRFSNIESIDGYLKAVGNGCSPIAAKKRIEHAERECEYIMLRLRLATGIDFKDYSSRFNKDFALQYKKAIDITKSAGLIHIDKKSIRPTIKGFDLQNALICEFIKN